MTEVSRVKSSLQHMGSERFEELVASVWSEMGWSTQVSRPSKDQGIDIVATKTNLVDEKALIQAKRYNEENKVGRPEIQQYSSLDSQFPDADSVVVVTTSEFTTEATQLARQLGVKTVNGIELAEACVKNLSENQLSTITNRSIEHAVGDEPVNQRHTEQIRTDELTEAELDLAEFYSGYIRRLSKAVQDGSYSRVFFVNVDHEHDETSEYNVNGVTHQIKFPAESPKLLAQLRKTAEKYGWDVLDTETYGSGAGGVEMVVPPAEAEMFLIKLETRTPESPVPERQARIINLILDRVYDQELSGTEIIDLPQGGHLDSSVESTTRVIR